ncbi:hypothetical protein A3F64_01530 [Candidatus Saccharibacteria bacterium RIFCSPHIGHO2_12_FULL_42_8]|nr:MAG: hypothetical protein A3F64_01530 [Candidatus Saccharibacteria bacterium RIFCSPHIGHO2_12_FULL_42_8]
MILKRIKNTLLSISAIVFLSGVGTVCITPPYALADTKKEVQTAVDDLSDGHVDGTNKIKSTIRDVINIMLFLIGMIAVLMIVIAGFRFVTSNGDSNTVSSAKNTIIYAVIGIVVAVMAYAIVNFILDNIA